MRRISEARKATWRLFNEEAGIDMLEKRRISWRDYNGFPLDNQREIQRMIKDEVLIADARYIRVGNGGERMARNVS